MAVALDPTKSEEFEALLSYRWKEWVEASLKLRGVDPWAQEHPGQFLRESCKTEEKGCSCVSRDCGSIEEALTFLVKDCFSYLPE